MKWMVLIVDDEADSRLLLRQYCEDVPSFSILGEAKDGIMAVAMINDLKPDLIFLDIQMPGLNGFEVLQRVDHMTKVVFATAYEAFAIKAFDINAIDYLLKPFTKERFLQTVNKVMSTANEDLRKIIQLSEYLQSSSTYLKYLFVENKNRLTRIDPADIIRLEAFDDYTKIITLSGPYLSSYGISFLEQKLDPSLFLRVHRSAIININHLTEVIKDGSEIVFSLRDGSKQKVGRTYKDAVKRFIV